METQARSLWTIFISGWTFLSLVFLSGWSTPHSEIRAFHALQLPAIEFASQATQAKELLNRTPASLKISAKDDEEENRRNFILQIVHKSLPAAYQSQAGQIAETLILEANRHHLDPMFLVAVIMTESKFNPLAKGSRGDAGLMQILPGTAKWIAKREKIKGTVSLYNPIMNIKIGAAYFAHLRAHFAHVGSRYLAAYNMGTVNVHRLLDAAKEPKIYANRVIKNYEILYRELAVSNQSEPSSKIANL